MLRITSSRTAGIIFLVFLLFSMGKTTITPCITTTVTVSGVNYDFTPDFNA